MEEWEEGLVELRFSCGVNRPRMQRVAELCGCVSWGEVTLPQGQSLSQGRGHSVQPGFSVPGPPASKITAWLPRAALWGWCETKQKALLWYWVPKNSCGWAQGGVSYGLHALSLVLRGVPMLGAWWW